MGKIEKEDICPIKIISFDSDVSTPAKQNDTTKLDVIKQLIKYANTSGNVDITLETVPISFDNASLANSSIANEPSSQLKEEAVIDTSNFNGLYSDLEYLDEFEPVVQTFIEKPASVSHLDKNKKMETNTFLETNTAQTDTDISDNTSDDEDSIMEYLRKGLSPNEVNQISYIDSVIKGLSEKYKKQRIFDHSVLQDKCDFFCKKLKETNHAKVFPRQITTYLFKKINETCTMAEWNHKDYDEFGNVTDVVGNTEVLKSVEWDYCRQVLDKRKKEIVPAPTSDNSKCLSTQYTIILNAENKKDDRYLTVFDTRNNSLFQMKIEEAIENTNAVNMTNPSSKEDSYLYDPDGKKRKYIPKREQSSYIVKMKMMDKGYLCTKCKKLVAHKKNYVNHMRKHFAKKRLHSRKSSDLSRSENKTPGGRFPPCSSLVHKKIRRSGKPFMCDECGRSVKRLDTFRNHLMSHAGVKPYRCHICERRFLQKHALKAHQLVHSGEKPYPCNICPKRYKKMVTLKEHLKLVHNIIHPGKKRIRSADDEEIEESRMKKLKNQPLRQKK